MLKRLASIFLTFGLICPAMAVAITPEEVSEAVEAAKGAPRNRALQNAAGDALKSAGRYAEALTFYAKGSNSANLGAAEAAFYLYDFDRASELLDKYLAKRTKAEAAQDVNFSYRPGAELSDWTDYLSSRIDMGRSMLDRVEKIQVIDSVNVPADEFFRFVKLARSAGQIVGEEALRSVITDSLMDSLGLDDISGTGYVSEAGDDIIWTAADTEGNSKVYESSRLSDGKWDAPVLLFDYATVFGNTDGAWISSPYLMSDGVTLYFAADGSESLGGFDIFISRRDANGYLQPSNIGMPYNSPFNDYLYAVDEETGAGWWVTDRNQIADSVTVYTFIPEELRNNWPVDTPGLADYAKVSSISATQSPDANYTPLRRKIANLEYGRTRQREADFEFALPDGRIMRHLSDFPSALSRKAMSEYLTEKGNVDKLADDLQRLREKYAGGDTSVSEQIISLEDQLDTRRSALLDLKNQVVLNL